MPLRQLASLTVARTGLHAEDTAGLAHAQQLTALDLSCNPCLSEACLQHLHGGASVAGFCSCMPAPISATLLVTALLGFIRVQGWKLHSQLQGVILASQLLAAIQPAMP